MNNYVKTAWVDNTIPALDAAHLNHIEDGIEAATQGVRDVETDKEDKSNKAARITSSNIGSGTNYPSIAAVAHYLTANYYDKSDIDDSTYTKAETEQLITHSASLKESKSNKVTSISGSSTNEQYPSALAVKNYVDSALGVPSIPSISGIDGKAIFSVENPIVADYIANVTYDPTDYSSTEIITYYRTATSYRKDQPSGGTITVKNAGTLSVYDERGKTSQAVSAGNSTVYNLTPGAVDPYIVTDASGNGDQGGTLAPTGQVRMIKCDGVNNMRDIGGWSCDGGKLKYGLAFRGGELENATAPEIEAVDSLLQIADEIDLRNTAEIPNDVSEFPYADYVRIQLGQYLTAVDLTNETMTGRTVTVLRRIFENVKHNRPTYFHCVSGADRTGTIAFLLEAVCGVSRSDMDKDYELTCFTNEGENATRSRVLTNWKNLVNYINNMDGTTYRDKAVSWCILAGLTLSEINAFRHAMIDGSPTDVTNQVDYSCKGVTLDKDSDSVNVGGTVTLTATLSPVWATGTVSWSTSSSSVATVSGNGKTATVTGVAAGNATITATCNGHSDTFAVTVVAAQLVYTVITSSATHGIKIDSYDHKTETTGQNNYAATPYTSTTGYTHFRLSNEYTGIPHDGTGVSNVYINWYDANQNYLSCTSTVGTNKYAAMTPLEGTIPANTSYYRVRAYSGESQKEAWFDAMTVELGKYE